ncbi:MAG: hypothetical protein RJA41_732 [Actinomycetota bacterium]|jgi:hypothetical protein
MNGLIFSFAKDIPIERFDNTKVLLGIKGEEKIYTGLVRVDLDNSLVILETDPEEHLYVEFDEIALLRWPSSGIVHDYWGEERGELIHVPTLVTERHRWSGM